MSLWCRLVTRIIVISVNYITSHAQKREFSSFVTVHVCKKNWKKTVQGNADSGIQEIFSSGIRDPGNLLAEYPEYLSRNPEFQELLASAILVPMIKNWNLVNGFLNPWNAGSKAVLDFITLSRSRQMIACFLSLRTDSYLEQTACFIYFLQVIWLTIAGPVMGFFRGGEGGKRRTRESTSQRPDKAIKCTFSIYPEDSVLNNWGQFSKVSVSWLSNYGAQITKSIDELNDDYGLYANWLQLEKSRSRLRIYTRSFSVDKLLNGKECILRKLFGCLPTTIHIMSKRNRRRDHGWPWSLLKIFHQSLTNVSFYLTSSIFFGFQTA